MVREKAEILLNWPLLKTATGLLGNYFFSQFFFIRSKILLCKLILLKKLLGYLKYHPRVVINNKNHWRYKSIVFIYWDQIKERENMICKILGFAEWRFKRVYVPHMQKILMWLTCSTCITCQTFWRAVRAICNLCTKHFGVLPLPYMLKKPNVTYVQYVQKIKVAKYLKCYTYWKCLTYHTR